jgi:hypothetical protein
MAKAGRRGSQTGERIEAFAEDLGRLLGTARAKADDWMSQREQIAKQLADIRDTASKLLTDLGHQAQSALRRRGAGHKNTYAPAPVSRRRRRKMSAAARAKIAEAQRQRWARQKQAAAAAKREKK